MALSPFSDLNRPPLSARGLGRALVTPGALWTLIDVREETGSTNADAADAARAGAPQGLVVVAERQTQGRGRRGREWTSPRGAGLTMSVLLRPGDRVKPVAYSWLPLLAGVALREAVERTAEMEARLKWPNDLLVATPDGVMGKCAGILAEVSGDAVVVGIGLNVTTRADELPEVAPGALPPTSLALAGAREADRDTLLRAVLRGLAGWYEGWREAEGDAELCGLLAAYRRGCATIGRQVRVLLPGGGELAGEATDVDGDGQLVVRTADGATHRVSAGDVLHVR